MSNSENFKKVEIWCRNSEKIQTGPLICQFSEKIYEDSESTTRKT